mmetsp:Transcript_24549/g.55136  ORF Transcript_24549/g.55136 Transcript_24549/m.55136 type:complete len:115 (-) Transcript_24549:85-429(-)
MLSLWVFGIAPPPPVERLASMGPSKYLFRTRASCTLTLILLLPKVYASAATSTRQNSASTLIILLPASYTLFDREIKRVDDDGGFVSGWGRSIPFYRFAENPHLLTRFGSPGMP